MVFSGFLFWKNNDAFRTLLPAGGILLVIGLVIPVLLKPVYWIWMVFATIVQLIMTGVILSLLFYVVFTSVGLIPRLFGKQFIELKWDNSKDSYWNYRSVGEFNKGDYEKQF